MLFYFAWIEEMDSFNPQIHARHDEEILDLQITEQEGLFPRAVLTVPAKNPGNRKPYAIISYGMNGKVHLFFKGRLVRFPIALNGETHNLELVAEPSDADQKLKELARTLQQAPYYDPLFVAIERRLDPDIHELLDARDDLIYWSRTMDQVTLSNIFQGRRHVDLGERFYYDSLRVQLTDFPLKQIEVELHIQWRQRCRGEAILDHLLHAALPQGMIATLTGSDLEARWWQDGEAIGRSGYHLSHSALTKIDKFKDSASFWMSPYDPLSKRLNDKGPRKVRLKKSYYRPQLKVSWRYCQKRVERLFFTLVNDVQNLGYHSNRKRALRLHLHDGVAEEQHIEWQPNRIHLRGEKIVQAGRLFLCLRTHRSGATFVHDPQVWKDMGLYHESTPIEARGTFFATDRGTKAVEHAIEIARAHLAASTRAVEVKLVCDLADAVSLTCDHTVTIQDDRLPGIKMTGKVKKLVFEVLGKTGRATASITLACSLGQGQEHPISIEKKDLYAEDYFTGPVVNDTLYHKTASGITYQSFFDQVPEKGHVYPAFWGARDILKGIKLVNNAEEQEKHLQQHEYPHGHNLQQTLRQVKTGFSLWFEDLRSVGALEHHIHLKILDAWSAPKQINLGEKI